jgi:ParB family chromosome partitioning protein
VVKHKSGLGRGLDALFTNTSDTISKPGGQLSSVSSHEVPLAPIDSLISNPRQPRHTMQGDDPKLFELSHSIQEHGLIQPIIVKRLPKEASTKNSSSAWFDEESSGSENHPDPAPPPVSYQIIAGERRWRAAKMAGLTEVPIVIRDVTPLQMLELALIENIQRADLNPIEEATAYQTLVKEFGLTQEMVAKQVGKDRTTITNSLRLLQLTTKVREALASQLPNFTEGHARTLVGITREEDQILAMQKIIAEGLNVRQAEALATRMKDSQKFGEEATKEVTEVTKAPIERPSELEHLESQFREALMVKVNLKCNPKGKGTLVLHFNNQEELENLYRKLVKSQE